VKAKATKTIPDQSMLQNTVNNTGSKYAPENGEVFFCRHIKEVMSCYLSFEN
jgi:hypothetical protein